MSRCWLSAVSNQRSAFSSPSVPRRMRCPVECHPPSASICDRQLTGTTIPGERSFAERSRVRRPVSASRRENGPDTVFCKRHILNAMAGRRKQVGPLAGQKIQVPRRPGFPVKLALGHSGGTILPGPHPTAGARHLLTARCNSIWEPRRSARIPCGRSSDFDDWPDCASSASRSQSSKPIRWRGHCWFVQSWRSASRTR